MDTGTNTDTDILEFRYDYYFLSNFYRYKFTYKDINFLNSEQAYQYAKAETDKDRIRVLLCSTPTEAKRIGHSIKCDIKKWDIIKVGVMKEILSCKFSNGKLKKKLLETGSRKLVEGNYWHDNFWGSCYCPRCKNFQGKNSLGKILMEIRTELV